MTKFEKIKNIIKEYRAEADEIFAEYCQKEAWARNEYREEAFKTRMKTEIYPHYYGKLHGLADFSINEIDGLFKEIQREFDEWVVKPVDRDVLATLDCIREYGLNLSLSELRIVEQSVVGSYFGTRIFEGLAKLNGYSVETMNADSYHEAIRAARENAVFSIQAYAGGEGLPGRDLLDTRKYHGIDYGEYTPQDMIMALNFLRDGGELDRLEKMWEGASAPMKYRLTEKEEEKIKGKLEKILDPSGNVVRDKAAELLKEEPDIANKLDSFSSDYPGRDAVETYFGVRRNRPDDASVQSKISGAVPAAADYLAGCGKVDMELLKQFT